MTEDMQRLVERIEAASAPDREMDCRIAHAIDWRHPSEKLSGEPESCRAYVQHWLMIKDDDPGFTHPDRCKWSEIPAYTASIDAAMTLVGNDCFRIERHPMYGVYAFVGDDDAYAETPALALTLAALRSRITERHNNG